MRKEEKWGKHLVAYALGLPRALADYPFDEETLTVKVMGRIFLLTSPGYPVEISLKCDPFRSQELREMFPFIKPGYHLNKKHWITVTITDKMPLLFYEELISHSYTLVVKKLKKTEREALELEKERPVP